MKTTFRFRVETDRDAAPVRGARRRIVCALLLVILSGVRPNAPAEETVDVARWSAALRAVGPKAAGHREAMIAIDHLSKADASQLPELLAAMDGANALAMNWLRAAVETVVQRARDAGGRLPVEQLEAFLRNARHAPRARRLAYELIRQVDATAEQRLIPGMLHDPSLELRRDAVALAIRRADAILKRDRDRDRAVAAYRDLLSAARDLDQIRGLAQKLRRLGQPVDLPRHFGFILRWKLVGPFDNSGQKGFDVAYGPEKNLNLTAQYMGKTGQSIRWFDVVTGDQYGLVDLNKVLGKYKGAIAYAYARFVSARDQDVELRLGCINANKVWLNGKLLIANNIYHTNTSIDQYIGKGRMHKGRNVILLKICQNEQTESWAQRWQYQLRVCDRYGTAILSLDRPGGPTVWSGQLSR